MTSGASLVELEFALDTRAIPRNVLLVYSTFPPLHGELGDRRISQALALNPWRLPQSPLCFPDLRRKRAGLDLSQSDAPR